MPATPETDSTPSDDLDELLDRGLRYAVSLTRDRCDAKDLLQDAAASMLAKGLEWKIISNYTNHVAATPLDEAFASGAWSEAPACACA